MPSDGTIKKIKSELNLLQVFKMPSEGANKCIGVTIVVALIIVIACVASAYHKVVNCPNRRFFLTFNLQFAICDFWLVICH